MLLLAIGSGGIGCDDGDSGSVTPLADAETADANSADMGAISQEDAVSAFCESAAAAQCNWAFECVGASPALANVLGLSGPSKANCVTGATAECAARAATLADRGTLEFNPDGADACVTRLGAAPCGMGSPADWVANYNSYVTNNCHGALRGTVDSGGDCTDRLDCANKAEICAGGQCRIAEHDDLLSPCDAIGGGAGALSPDASCSGGVCAEMQTNEEEIAGLCTVDCASGFGCPSGDFCLQFSITGGATHFLCTRQCERDAECGPDLSCVAVSDDPNTKHCFVTAE